MNEHRTRPDETRVCPDCRAIEFYDKALDSYRCPVCNRTHKVPEAQTGTRTPGLKFYLASSFDLIPRVQAACDLLEYWGHTITEKWWDRTYPSGHTTILKKKYKDLAPGLFYQLKETERSYLLDFKAIVDCDIFLFVADDKVRRYNGACVELGIALAYGKPCYLLGILENSALFYDVKRLPCLDQLIYDIKQGNVKTRVSRP